MKFYSAISGIFWCSILACCVTDDSEPWLDWLREDVQVVSVVLVESHHFSDPARAYTQRVLEDLQRRNVTVRVSTAPLATRAEPGQSYLLVAQDDNDIAKYYREAEKGAKYFGVCKIEPAFNSRSNVLILMLKDELHCEKKFLANYFKILSYLWNTGKYFRVALMEEWLTYCPYALHGNFVFFNPFVSERDGFTGDLTIENLKNFASLSRILDKRFLNLNRYVINVKSYREAPWDIPEESFFYTVYQVQSLMLEALYEKKNASFRSMLYSVSQRGFPITRHLVVNKYIDIMIDRSIAVMESFECTDIFLPTTFETIEIVVPKGELHSPLTLLFRCFPPPVWAALFASYVVTSVVWRILHNASWQQSFSDMVFVFTTAGWTGLHRVRSHSQRVLMTFCLLLCGVVIASLFLGAMYGLIMQPTREVQVDTLEQLDQSGLPIYAISNPFREVDDELYKRLSYKTRIVLGTELFQILSEMPKHKNYTIVLQTDIIENMRSMQPDKFAKFHRMKERMENKLVTNNVRKRFPYLSSMNRIISGLIESGIMSLWEEYFNLNRKRLHQIESNKTYTSESEFKTLSLTDLQAPFLILAIGLSSSSLVLLFEICFNTFVKKRGR